MFPQSLSLKDFKQDRLYMRYALQRHIRTLLAEYQRHVDLTTGELRYRMAHKQTYRVCRCSQFTIPSTPDQERVHKVQLYLSQHGKAHFGNLERCSSIWICPVCAAKIAERRRQELQQVLDATTEYQKVMLTFTLRHSHADDLSSLRDHLLKVLRQFRQSDFRMIKDRYGWFADVRTIEITYGVNGWHPHVHMLVFLQPHLDAGQLEDFEHDCRLRWRRIVRKNGYDCSYYRGCWVDSTDRKIADYIAKFGHDPSETTLHAYNGGWGEAAELAMSTNKVGRYNGLTPWQLVLCSMAGESEAGDLFKIYAKATKGKRQMEYSRSPDIRQIVGLRDYSDEELVEEETASSRLLLSIDLETWFAVTRSGQQAALLRLAESGDAAQVERFLQGVHTPHAKHH